MSSGSDGEALYRIPVAGGRPQRITTASTTSAWGGVLSPDGTSYAYSAVERGWAFLEVVSTSGGAPRRIAPRDERVWNTRGVWSRDGSRIAISDWQFDDDGTENIAEYSLDGSAPRELTSRPASYESPGAYTSDGRLVYTAQVVAATIVRVSVAELLAGK